MQPRVRHVLRRVAGPNRQHVITGCQNGIAASRKYCSFLSISFPSMDLQQIHCVYRYLYAYSSYIFYSQLSDGSGHDTTRLRLKTKNLPMKCKHCTQMSITFPISIRGIRSYWKSSKILLEMYMPSFGNFSIFFSNIRSSLKQ